MTSRTALSRLVVFRAASEQYGLDVSHVERVLRYTTPRPVPGLPAWIEGIVDLDGSMIPVIDVRARLGKQVAAVAASTRLLLLQIGSEKCALIVDQVLDVRAYDPAELLAAPPLVSAWAGPLIRGSIRRGEHLVLVLSAEGLLNADEQADLSLTGA